MSFHIENAINLLHDIDGAHSRSYYEDHSVRNQVDGLLDTAFDHVMNAQTHDERGDYRSAHSALLSGTKAAAQAHKLITANGNTSTNAGTPGFLEQSVIGYKHENFS